MAEYEHNQPDNNERPVFVYIRGRDISTPTYEELVDIKRQCEKHGQKFLLIPEPDANGNPVDADGKIMNIRDLSIQDVERTLKKYFGKGGEFRGLNYTSYIDIHGTYFGEDIDIYKHSINTAHGKYGDTEAIDVYGAIIRNGNCTEMFDSACHSGVGIRTINQALFDLDKKRDFHFLASARHNEMSSQNDGADIMSKLPTLAESGKAFTVNNLKQLASESTSSWNSSGFVEVIFNKNNRPNNKFFINYEDQQEKLESLFGYLKNGLKSEEIDPQIMNAVKLEKNAKEFTENLKLQKIYYKALKIADDLYDKYEESPNNSIFYTEKMAAAHTILPYYTNQLDNLKSEKQIKEFLESLLYNQAGYSLNKTLYLAKLFDDEPKKLTNILSSLADTEPFLAICYEDRIKKAFDGHPKRFEEVMSKASSADPEKVLTTAGKNPSLGLESLSLLAKRLNPETMKSVLSVITEDPYVTFRMLYKNHEYISPLNNPDVQKHVQEKISDPEFIQKLIEKDPNKAFDFRDVLAEKFKDSPKIVEGFFKTILEKINTDDVKSGLNYTIEQYKLPIKLSLNEKPIFNKDSLFDRILQDISSNKIAHSNHTLPMTAKAKILEIS